MKEVFSLQNAPLWFLGALAGIAGVVLWRPALAEGLPPTVRAYFLLGFVALTILFVAASFSRVFAARAARRQRAADRDRLRLEKIYAPLVSLFVTRHVVMSSMNLAPRFGDRLPAARQALRRGSITNRPSRAIRALLDPRTQTSSEIEYGGDFPLQQIKKIIQTEAAIVDSTLRGLVRQADHASYEPPTTGALSPEEQALFLHIQTVYATLDKRLNPRI